MSYGKWIWGCMLLTFSITTFSQSKQYLYYFDKDLNTTKKQEAVFNGIGVYENGFLEFKIFNASNKNLVLIQHFTDSSLQESNGIFQSFYPNNTMESIGNYLKGKEDGLWQRADSLGLIIDSSWYEEGRIIKYIHRGYFKSGYPDSVIINDITKDELQKIFYFDSGVVANKVHFSGNKGLEQIFDNGIVTRTDSVFSREEIEASFPGGAAAWMKYIIKGLQNNADELYKDNVFGTCIIKFIVDINGKVKEVKAQNMTGSKLAEIGMRIIRNSPKWNPASQYGRWVNGYRIQPVTLNAL